MATKLTNRCLNIKSNCLINVIKCKSRSLLFPCTGSKVAISKLYSSQNMSNGQKVLVNGSNIYYEKIGKGEHPVLFLSGALGCIKTDFVHQFAKMNKDKFTLIGCDLKGYGESRPPRREFHSKFLHDDAEDAATLMKVLGYSSYSLVGWSDGANVSAILASRHSKNIQRLVLFAGNSFISQDEVAIYKRLRDISLWSERMRQPMIDVYGEEEFTRLWHSWTDTFLKMAEGCTGNIDLYSKELSKISCNTLIIQGDKDPMVDPQHPHYLKENIKNSRLYIWPGGKHNLHMKYADEFNEMVETFLSEDSKL